MGARSRAWWLSAGVAAVAACGGGTPTQPGQPGQPADSGKDYRAGVAAALPGNGPGRDENPSVLRAKDGRIWVAWNSDKGGNADIYITSTNDGRSWTAPVRITSSTDGDYAPSLMQDAQGTFHLAWYRSSAPGRGTIWYTSSANGTTWNSTSEQQATTAGMDDANPALIQAPDGSLLIYFVSALRGGDGATADLYLTQRAAGQAAWQTYALPVLSSQTQVDQLPFVAKTNLGISLTWVRYAPGPTAPGLAPKADVYFVASLDGINWLLPRQVTNDAGNVASLYPSLTQDAAGPWELMWGSNRGGSAAVVQLPLERIGEYPGALATMSQLPAGVVSPRLVATPTAGLYLAVWAQGADATRDIWYRVIAK